MRGTSILRACASASFTSSALISDWCPCVHTTSRTCEGGLCTEERTAHARPARQSMSKATPLESWIAEKIGLSNGELTPEKIAEYQLRNLRETLRWARSHSPFYSQRLCGVSEGEPGSFAAFEGLPFTDATDLQEQGLQFLCVPQGDINRVVTLESSGTSGAPKRVFFTAADQELTIDFFR